MGLLLSDSVLNKEMQFIELPGLLQRIMKKGESFIDNKRLFPVTKVKEF